MDGMMDCQMGCHYGTIFEGINTPLGTKTVKKQPFLSNRPPFSAKILQVKPMFCASLIAF